MSYEALYNRYRILKKRDRRRAKKLIKLQQLHKIIVELSNIGYFVAFAGHESLNKKLEELKNILAELEEKQ